MSRWPKVSAFADRSLGKRTGGPREGVSAAATRCLATILAADVAGYSRLIGADEEGMMDVDRRPGHEGGRDRGIPRRLPSADLPRHGGDHEVGIPLGLSIDVVVALAGRNTWLMKPSALGSSSYELRRWLCLYEQGCALIII
jgi:hypothetical protein